MSKRNYFFKGRETAQYPMCIILIMVVKKLITQGSIYITIQPMSLSVLLSVQCTYRTYVCSFICHNFFHLNQITLESSPDPLGRPGCAPDELESAHEGGTF